jgi:hypothetical protein
MALCHPTSTAKPEHLLRGVARIRHSIDEFMTLASVAGLTATASSGKERYYE